MWNDNLIVVNSPIEAITAMGIDVFNNQVVQDRTGQFFFVDLDIDRFMASQGGVSVKSCVFPLPAKIGMLLISVMRLKKMALQGLSVPQVTQPLDYRGIRLIAPDAEALGRVTIGRKGPMEFNLDATDLIMVEELEG